jgi:hypothetical protein
VAHYLQDGLSLPASLSPDVLQQQKPIAEHTAESKIIQNDRRSHQEMDETPPGIYVSQIEGHKPK